MKTLETNDWIILNTIIYKVYTMEDFDGMRKELLEQLKLLVDFDSADFYLASAEDEKKLAAAKDGTANRSWVEKSLEEKGVEIIDDKYRP